MVTITLKSKEFLLIAYTLLSEESNSTFGLLSRIKTATNLATDDQLVSVDASTEEVEDVYKRLTNAPEGIFNNYNDSMFTQLTTQIQDGISNNDSDWILIGSKISAIRTENLARADAYVAYAKLKLS